MLAAHTQQKLAEHPPPPHPRVIMMMMVMMPFANVRKFAICQCNLPKSEIIANDNMVSLSDSDDFIAI